MVPPSHWYNEALRLPLAHPDGLVCLVPSVPPVLLVRSRRARSRRPRAWVLVSGSPAAFFDGDERISQVPGESLPACPALGPRWTGPSSPYRCGSMRPSDSSEVVGSTGSNYRGSITRPTGSLSTLRRPGHPGTTQDSLPARWLGFGRAGLSPAGLLIEFQIGRHLSFSRTRLLLAQRTVTWYEHETRSCSIAMSPSFHPPGQPGPGCAIDINSASCPGGITNCG